MANVRDIFPNYWDQSQWHTLAGGSGFGNADVDVLLKDAAGAPDRFDNVGNLQEARRLILQFMDSAQGRAVTASQNQPGGYAPEGHPGMYIKLSNNEIYETWGDHQGESGADRARYFGGADLRVALAKGISKETIVTKLEEKGLEWLKPGSVNVPISQGGDSEGVYTFLVGEEASTIYGKSSVEPIPGAGGSLFGNVDYFKNLERLWEQSDQNPSVLHEYREDVLDFLATDSENVHANNRPPSMGGSTTGMWQQIHDHKRRQETGGRWGPDDVKITPWFGGQEEGARTDFTEADRLAAIAGGHSSYDIYRHLHSNPDQRSSSAAAETYKNVRTNLINMQPEYSEYNSDNWRQRMENPVWYEIGVHLSSTNNSHSHRTWVDIDDYRVLRDYIRESLGSAGIDMPGHKNSASDNVRFTEEHLSAIIGDTAGSPTGYEAGEYWSQWGVEGPPDLDQGDGHDKSDLTWIQKMVAASGIHSVDTSDWENRLEYIENRFLGELFEGRPDGSDVDDPYGPRFKDASDEWGLDIMRLDAEGQALRFDDAQWSDTDQLHGSSDEWYETLTRGNIDWAFYQDSSIYQEAKKQLGLQGTFTAGSLGVAGIREANVWVHGQQTVMPSDDDVLKSWVKYEAKPLPEPYTPKDLTITGYTPDKPKGLAPVPDDPTAPNINIPDVKITRPSNLDRKLGKIVGEGSDNSPPPVLPYS